MPLAVSPSVTISPLPRHDLPGEPPAPRTKALSPKQILERLSQRLDLLKGGRDADPRQQTLRATIEWSYDLLSDEEAPVWALGVFAGGCTLEAAEEVCDADSTRCSRSSRRASSVSRTTASGCWRRFASTRAGGSSEAAGGDKCRAPRRVLPRSAPRQHLEGTHQQARWLGRIEIEHDNARAALSFFETAD